MRTKRRNVTTIILLAAVLLLSMACVVNEDDKYMSPRAAELTPVTPVSGDASPVIVKRFAGQGTHNEVSVLGELVTSCAVPYEVTATVDNKGILVIEGTGACIGDYSSCSLSDAERCSISARGSLTEKNEASINSCNSSLEVIENRLTVSDKSMAGTYKCSLGGGDTTGLTFDLALLP